MTSGPKDGPPCWPSFANHGLTVVAASGPTYDTLSHLIGTVVKTKARTTVQDAFDPA